jgi:hypothetical protein
MTLRSASVAALLTLAACNGPIWAQLGSDQEFSTTLEDEVADLRTQIQGLRDEVAAVRADFGVDSVDEKSIKLNKRLVVEDLEVVNDASIGRNLSVGGAVLWSGRDLSRRFDDVDVDLATLEAELSLLADELAAFESVASPQDVNGDGTFDRLRVIKDLRVEGGSSLGSNIQTGQASILDTGGSGSKTTTLHTVDSQRSAWLVTSNAALYGGAGGGAAVVFFSEAPGGCRVVTLASSETTISCSGRDIRATTPLGYGYYSEVSWLHIGGR